jgi:hypothetical protein
MFKVKEAGYAMDNKGDAYTSVVTAVRRSAPGARHEYKVHYNGWNPKWDEWMDNERLFKRTISPKYLLSPTQTLYPFRFRFRFRDVQYVRRPCSCLE